MKNQEHHTHTGHSHLHGEGCGHKKIKHGNHFDFLHDGHLHTLHESHVDECKIEIDANNTAECTPNHECHEHASDHRHGPDCGHEAVPHGDHVDYLVGGHLHRFHENHCDDHGPLSVS